MPGQESGLGVRLGGESKLEAQSSKLKGLYNFKW
jgi:hypothetical protein